MLVKGAPHISYEKSRFIDLSIQTIKICTLIEQFMTLRFYILWVYSRIKQFMTLRFYILWVYSQNFLDLMPPVAQGCWGKATVISGLFFKDSYCWSALGLTMRVCIRENGQIMVKCHFFMLNHLTHLPMDKMAAVSQAIFSDAFSWMKCFVFWLNFHWS